MSKSGWWAAVVLVAVVAARSSEPGDAPPEVLNTIQSLQSGRTGADRRQAARDLGRASPPSPQALDALRKGLADPDVLVVRESARALAYLGTDSRKSVTAVLQALRGLKNPPPEAVADVVLSLRYFGPDAEPAVKMLTHLLDTKDRQVRVAVMTTLQSIGPAAREAVPALTALMQDKKAAGDDAAVVRAHAAFTLWKITGDKTVTTSLTRELALSQAGSAQRRVALEFLGKMGPDAAEASALLLRAVSTSLAVERKELKAGEAPTSVKTLISSNVDQVVMPTLTEIGPGGRQAVPVLTNWLTSARERQVPAHRWRLPLRALAAIGPDAQSAVATIKPLLEVRDQNVHLDAALALYCVANDEAALSVLLNALKEDDSTLQKDALECLGRGGPASAVSSVRVLLDHDYSDVRGLALLTWAKLDPSAAAAEHAAGVLRRSDSREEKHLAVQALAVLGPLAKPFGPELRRLIADADQDKLRDAAFDALVRSGSEMAPVRPDVAIKDPRLAALTARLRKVDSAEVDREVLREIADLRPMPLESLALWNDLLGRRDPHLTRVAACALGRLGDQGADAVAALTQAGRGETSVVVLEEIILALIAIGPRANSAVPFLVEAARHYDPKVRALAVSGLMTVGRENRDAIESLKRVLKHDDLTLQVKAALALATIAPEENGVVALAALLVPPGSRVTSAKSQGEAAVALVRLAKLGNKEAIDVLVRFVQLLAKQADADREKTAGPTEVRSVQEPARQASVVLTGLSDVPTAVQEIKPLLPRLYRGTQWPAALFPLIRHADEQDRSLLQDVLASARAESSSPANAFARGALFRLGKDDVDLVALGQSLSARDATVREATLLAVKELGAAGKPLAPRVRNLLPVLNGSSLLLAEVALWTVERDEEALASLVRKCDELAWDDLVWRALADLARQDPQVGDRLRRVALDAAGGLQRLLLLEALHEAAGAKR